MIKRIFVEGIVIKRIFIKRIFYYLMALVVWFQATLLASSFWVTQPSRMPSLPRPLWQWAYALYRPDGAEEIFDMEYLLIFSICGFCVAVLLAIILALAGRVEQLKSRRK